MAGDASGGAESGLGCAPESKVQAVGSQQRESKAQALDSAVGAAAGRAVVRPPLAEFIEQVAAQEAAQLPRAQPGQPVGSGQIPSGPVPRARAIPARRRAARGTGGERARGDAAPKLSQDSAFMHDLEGVFSAMDREDWHSALVGIDNAVQARVALLRGETARRHT